MKTDNFILPKWDNCPLVIVYPFASSNSIKRKSNSDIAPSIFPEMRTAIWHIVQVERV